MFYTLIILNKNKITKLSQDIHINRTCEIFNGQFNDDKSQIVEKKSRLNNYIRTSILNTYNQFNGTKRFLQLVKPKKNGILQ